MHVLLVAVSRATSPTGVCRHAANLAKALRGAEVRVTLLVGDWQERYFLEALALAETEVDVAPVGLSNTSLGRNWFYVVMLRRLLRRVRPDILHLAYPAPVLPSRWSGVTTVVSLHDLYALDAPEVFGARRAWGNRLGTLWGLRFADGIAVVSQATLRRLQSLYPELATKADVIPNGVFESGGAIGSTFATESAESFLLCVAQHRAHKRLDVLLEAFAELRKRGTVEGQTRLTIVGEHGPETERLLVLEQHLLPPGLVCWRRGVSDADLSALYHGALALVAASRIEGFGLPVAEALAAGCRVVCSGIEAHHEAAGDDATYFAANATANDIADAVECSLSQAPPVERRGGIRAQDMAAQYLEIYKFLLASGRARKRLKEHVEKRMDGGAYERSAR